MPLGRRRPIVRAAAVGTVAYRASERGAAAGEQEAEEQQPQAEAPTPPEAPPPPSAESLDPTAEKIKQLADLHASGALTDEEFAATKAKALGID
jgi:hypothetical protein